MQLTRSLLLCTIVTLASLSQVWAQTNEEAFEQFQWHVAAPDVRAQAMGGAVVASAGNASAGLTNPAGLIHVSRPELSVEFRRNELRVARFAAVNALVTGALTTSSETTNALSFVGGALPLRGNTVVIALARHEALAYESSFVLPPRAVPGVTGALRAQIPVDSQVDLEVVSHVASIGWAAHDRLSLGLSVSVDRLRANTLSTRHNVALGPGTFDLSKTAIIANQSGVTGTDVGVGFIVGGLYQPVRAISVGLMFARRPSLEASGDFQLNPGRLRGVNEPLASQAGFPKPISLNVPDQLSTGLAVRPHSRLLLAVDATYTNYSELARELTPVIGFDLVTAADFAISDGTAVHAGGEFNVASETTPVFLRAGVFTNPDHRLRFVGTVQTGPTITAAQAQRTNALERSRFNLGTRGTEVKGTFGGGFAVGPHALVDVAYVWKQAFVLSLGGRF